METPQSMYPSIPPYPAKLRGEGMGLAPRLGHVCPRSLLLESSHMACLQCCGALVWCRGSRDGRRHDRGRPRACRGGAPLTPCLLVPTRRLENVCLLIESQRISGISRGGDVTPQSEGICHCPGAAFPPSSQRRGRRSFAPTESREIGHGCTVSLPDLSQPRRETLAR